MEVGLQVMRTCNGLGGCRQGLTLSASRRFSVEPCRRARGALGHTATDDRRRCCRCRESREGARRARWDCCRVES